MPTAEDMAEYILTTGDQQTVAQLIEAMVEGGEVGCQAFLRNKIMKLVLVEFKASIKYNLQFSKECNENSNKKVFVFYN